MTPIWSPLALLVAGAASAPQNATPVFGVSVERIRVEVRVTQGRDPVRGLRAEDFELRDSGVVQQLEPLLAEGASVDTVLVIDRSDSVSGSKLQALREAGYAYLDAVRSGERVSLLGFSSRVTLQHLRGGDVAKVREIVGRASTGGSTALCDAIYAGLRLAEAGRRTAVVVFSDGFDNTSWLLPEQVVEAARRSDAVVYGVLAGQQIEGGEQRDTGPVSRRALRLLPGRSEPAWNDPSLLRDVATATGGRVFEVREVSEMRRRFLEVLEDIRSRYVLSYTPSGVDGAGWHPLQVRLRKAKGSVLARPGYWRPPSR